MKDIKRKLRRQVARIRKAAATPVASDLPSTQWMDIAVEVWRMAERLKRASAAPADSSIAFSVDKIRHALSELGIEARESTGEPYSEGMTVEVLAFASGSVKPEHPVIRETISPAIYYKGKLHKTAQVIVGEDETRENHGTHND